MRHTICLLGLILVMGLTGCTGQGKVPQSDTLNTADPTGAPTNEQHLLKVGYRIDGPTLPALMLQEGSESTEGILLEDGSRQKLEWKEAGSSEAIAEALSHHQLDVAYLDSVYAMKASVASKGDVVILAGVSSGSGVLVGQEALNYATIKDLDQKVIALEETGGVLEMLFEKQLKSHGLKSTRFGGTVSIQRLSAAQIKEGLKAGSIDGAVVSNDLAVVLEQTIGVKRWMEAEALFVDPAYPMVSLVTTRQALETKKQGIKALLKEHMAICETLHEKALASDSTVTSALAQHYNFEKETLKDLQLQKQVQYSWNPENKAMVQLIYLGLEMKYLKEEPKSDGFFRLELLSQLMKARQ